MCKREHLLSVLFTAAAILSIIAAREDANKKKKVDSYYKIARTCCDTQLITINNDFVSTYIQEDGVWESGVTKCVLENVKPSDVVVEIGANIGYYTTMIANILKSGSGRLISYEANEDVYRLAKASLILNNLDFKVQFKNVAVSDKVGEVKFSYCVVNPAVVTNLGTAHLSIRDDWGNRVFKQRIVKCVSLDDDLADIPSIDLLRMDIEGSECLALKGAKKLIARSPNLKIIMEWAPNALRHYCNIDEFIKEIRGYGFTAYIIDDEYFKKGKMKKLSDNQLKNTHLIDVLLKRE